MTSMELQMIRTLAAIDAVLGMPENGCNSAQATLEAARDLVCEVNRLRVEVCDLKHELFVLSENLP